MHTIFVTLAFYAREEEITLNSGFKSLQCLDNKRDTLLQAKVYHTFQAMLVLPTQSAITVSCKNPTLDIAEYPFPLNIVRTVVRLMISHYVGDWNMDLTF